MFFPSEIPILRLSTKEFLLNAAVDIVETLRYPPETTTFQLKVGNKNTNTIYDLADILQLVKSRIQPKNTTILNQKKFNTFVHSYIENQAKSNIKLNNKNTVLDKSTPSLGVSTVKDLKATLFQRVVLNK